MLLAPKCRLAHVELRSAIAADLMTKLHEQTCGFFENSENMSHVKAVHRLSGQRGREDSPNRLRCELQPPIHFQDQENINKLD